AGDADTAASLSGSGVLSLGTGFAPASAFTLEAWAETATRSGTRYVLSKGSTTSGFHLYVTSGFPALKISTSVATYTLSAPSALAAVLATAAIAGPPARSDDPHAGFALSGSDPESAFTCALDDAAATSCTAAPAWDGLADGTHTLVVTPADRWGRAGTASSYSWIIDRTLAPDWSPDAPDSSIAASVGPATTRTDASFT